MNSPLGYSPNICEPPSSEIPETMDATLAKLNKPAWISFSWYPVFGTLGCATPVLNVWCEILYVAGGELVWFFKLLVWSKQSTNWSAVPMAMFWNPRISIYFKQFVVFVEHVQEQPNMSHECISNKVPRDWYYIFLNFKTFGHLIEMLVTKRYQ